MIEISAGNQIVNNISVANRNLPAADYLVPDPDAVKDGRNNVFIAQKLTDTKQSTLIYQGGHGLGIFISSAPRSLVYNNTCYLNEGGGRRRIAPRSRLTHVNARLPRAKQH